MPDKTKSQAQLDWEREEFDQRLGDLDEAERRGWNPKQHPGEWPPSRDPAPHPAAHSAPLPPWDGVRNSELKRNAIIR